MNCLNLEAQKILMGQLPLHNWSYNQVASALIKEYGCEAALTNQKMEFLEIQFKIGESIKLFATQFYMEAQTLISSKAAIVINAKLALLNALKES